MLFHLLKYYLCFVIAIFFRRKKIANKKYVSVNGPVIIAINHPNAFMDPVAFSALIYPPRVRYLARGDTFKKGIITWILESFGIIPIFRIQDGGKEGLKKNDDSYDVVNQLLIKNKKIIIFAEGLCVQERRLRPLKKGVSRMVFGAMTNFDLKNLTVVPVGVNYSNPSQFRSNVFFNIGEPMLVNNYMQAYNEAPAKTMNTFLIDLAVKMKSLIVHINHVKSEKLINHLEIILKSDYFKKEKLDLKNVEHDFLFSTHIVNLINNAEETQPENVVKVTEKAEIYFSELKKYKLRDWLLNQNKRATVNYAAVCLHTVFLIITLPIYIIGLIGNYLPYKLAYIITTKKVRIKEFKASFLMGIGAFLFLINYAIIIFITNYFLSGWHALFLVLLSLSCGYASLYFSPIRKKTFGMINVLSLKRKNSKVYVDLIMKRKEIIELFTKLTSV